MYYYRIRHSVDINVIGRKYPQIERVLIPTQWDSPDFIESYIYKKAPTDVLLPTPILNKISMLTDLLSASTVGLSLSLLISDKLKRIIEVSGFYGIQFFSVKVIHNDEEYPYWIIHPVEFAFDTINIEQSVMGYYSDISMKTLDRRFIPKDYMDVKTEIELFDKRINDGLYDGISFGISEIVFEKSGTIDFSPLRCVTGGIGFFVSENLKNEIEKAGCTGIVFTEPNERYP